MTTALATAFEKAATLPEQLQDLIALELTQDIDWELQWDQTLQSSENQLDRMAARALKEYRAGRTREMGFDDL